MALEIERAYRLRGTEKPKQGLPRIARARAQNAVDELQALDSEAVHEARKELKKLRAVLRLARDGLDRGFYRAESRRFREAGRELATARDARAKLETLVSLRDRFSDELSDETLDRYRVVLEQECESTLATLASGGVETAVDAIAEGRDHTAGWRLRGRDWRIVGRGLVRSYRRGRSAMQAVLSESSSDRVHEWRKRTKDLWYQLRVLRDAWPGLVKAAADELHELSDLLGDHHDLTTLVEDVGERDDLLTDREIVAVLLSRASKRQEALLSSAVECGERLYAETPKAFGTRFEAYWRTWRSSERRFDE